MPVDAASDGRSLDEIAASIGRHFNSLGATMPHSDPAVSDALKAAGVLDPQKVIDELKAKGFDIVGGAGIGGAMGAEAGKPPMGDEGPEMAPSEDELEKMPMDDARGAVAKFAFKATAPKKEGDKGKDEAAK